MINNTLYQLSSYMAHIDVLSPDDAQFVSKALQLIRQALFSSTHPRKRRDLEDYREMIYEHLNRLVKVSENRTVIQENIPIFAHTSNENKQMINFETIQEFNDMLGVRTQHPLVSVVNQYEAHRMKRLRHTMSFYAIFLKDEKNCELTYGRGAYDYDKGSVVCLAPGQVVGIEGEEIFQPQGYALFFDPELIHGTALGKHIKDYTYFSYEVNEALHLSDEERGLFINCLKMIQSELDHSIDRFSKTMITGSIELLLNYLLRFYERQFNTRTKQNSDLLTKFENLLDNYFKGNKAMQDGLPTVAFCASELCLSANYFGDLIKKETGISAQEHIKNKILEEIKEALTEKEKSITEISYELGFQYPQHLSRFFKKGTGLTPAQYRNQHVA